jgi:hypothetical protein
MNDLSRYGPGQGNGGPLQGAGPARQSSGTGLVDVLDRVLDKGVVIAGDIKINLLDIELLTVKVRLLIASADKAREMGIDWWAHDPELSSRAQGQQQRLEADKDGKALRERVGKLESKLDALTDLLERRLPEPAQRRARGG